MPGSSSARRIIRRRAGPGTGTGRVPSQPAELGRVEDWVGGDGERAADVAHHRLVVGLADVEGVNRLEAEAVDRRDERDQPRSQERRWEERSGEQAADPGGGLCLEG